MSSIYIYILAGNSRKCKTYSRKLKILYFMIKCYFFNFSFSNTQNIPGRRIGTTFQKIGWLLALSRNALVVIIGTVMAYIFYINKQNPFKLTGK